MEQQGKIWENSKNNSKEGEQELPAEKQHDGDSIEFHPITVSCTGGHNFYYMEGMTVKCRSCPIGYKLSAGTYLKNGHIYAGEQLLV